MLDKRIASLVVVGVAALSGCPKPADMPDAVATPDAASQADAFAGADAGTDAFVSTDTSIPLDAPGALPAITMPMPHRAPASAMGHDRYFGVVFDDESGFYVAGQTQAGTASTDDTQSLVAHFTASGDLDTSFGTGGFFAHNFAVGTNGEVARGIGLQSDGKIVVSVTLEHAGASDARDRDIAVFRLLPTGALDTTFGTGGFIIIDLSTGLLDGTTYVADGAWALAVDAMDRIVVSGQQVREGQLDSDFSMVRLTRNGALDTTFARMGIFSLDIGEVSASARAVQIGSDGSIYGSGYYTPTGGPVTPVVYKLDNNGALITAFGGGDGIYAETVLALQTEIYSIGFQGTNIVTAGYGRETGTTNDFISLRINGTTGVRDTTYGGRGYALLDMGWPLNDNARNVLVLPDNRVMMLGQLRGPVTADATTGDQDAALVMLTRDGALDTSFDSDGISTTNFGGFGDHYWSAAVDPTGTRVVVVGVATAFPVTNDDGAVYLFNLGR